MQASLPRDAKRATRLERLNLAAPEFGRIEHLETLPFGAGLVIERFRLNNGLQLLVCEDRSAPVIAFHTWFRVGSRNERPGKTGLAHLFEHLMFNETEKLKAGDFDRKLEEAGAESNASTWLDWTQYNVSVPKSQLGLVVSLEAERMSHLVLRDPQVDSEKEVVANERRYRVDDDVEGTVNEHLWAAAFERHPYRWPTIGSMEDILAFTTEDCRRFYETFYAPNNATLVVVGDLREGPLLQRIGRAYGHIPPSELAVDDIWPELPQTAERRSELEQPTPTQKLVMGYRAPAFGDADYVALSLLVEVLVGGRASRLHHRLVRQLELANEVRGYVGPFRDPGLTEFYLAARPGVVAEELLKVFDDEIQRTLREPVTQAEIDRACARSELGLLGGLTSVDGMASTIGFYETVLGRPNAPFERLAQSARLGPSDLLRVARRHLDHSQRSLIFVRPDASMAEPAA